MCAIKHNLSTGLIKKLFIDAHLITALHLNDQIWVRIKVEDKQEGCRELPGRLCILLRRMGNAAVQRQTAVFISDVGGKRVQ